MSRSFAVSFDSPASVGQVHSAFGDKAYWLARLEAFGTGHRTLDSLTVDPDGAVRVVSAEDLRHGGLPKILAAVYRGDLNIVTTEVWTPRGDGQVAGEITVAVTGAPGSGRGQATLAPSGDGSRLELTGTVQFNVPLVGGKVESYLAREFAEGIPEIQRFTTAWIGEHG
jgi:hypothetical protein